MEFVSDRIAHSEALRGEGSPKLQHWKLGNEPQFRVVLRRPELVDAVDPTVSTKCVNWLVVTGTMEFYDFPDIGNVIIPTDKLHHFSEGYHQAASFLLVGLSETGSLGISRNQP